MKRTNPQKLRVLIVPDLLPWICGTFAKRYAYHNADWLEATVCTGAAVRELVVRDREFANRFDLVHFLTHYDAEPNLKDFQGRIPCVLTIHHVEGKRCMALEPHCDSIGVPCSQWGNFLIDEGVDPEKIVATPYGMDVDCFRPLPAQERMSLRQSFGFCPGDFVIGFCAKRSSDSSGRKGIDIFERAVGLLTAKMPNAAVFIVGPGWAELTEWITRKGLKCFYIPFIDNPAALADFYCTLDAYWITSRIEGGPVPLLEAMSSGVCCITTPVGMALDIVKDGENGFIVPFDDAESFVARSLILCDEREQRKRLGVAARQTIVNGYQWHQMARRIWVLYRTAMERFNSTDGNACGTLFREPDPSFVPLNAEVNGPYLAAVPEQHRHWARTIEYFNFVDTLRYHGSPLSITSSKGTKYTSKGFFDLDWRDVSHKHCLKHGWLAFMSGDRRTAITLAFRSVFNVPWREGGWRLLACAFLKSPRRQ